MRLTRLGFILAGAWLAAGAGVLAAQQVPVPDLIAADDPRIVLLGRVDRAVSAAPRFGYPGTGWTLRFQGTDLAFDVESDKDTAALTLVLDDKQLAPAILNKGMNRVPVLVPATTWNSSGVTHRLEVIKRTETWQGIVTLRGVSLGTATLLSPPQLPARKLMFVGDSVTCGSGVNNNATCKNPRTDPATDIYDSYGMLLARRFDAQVQLVCYGGRGLERDYKGHGEAEGVLNAPLFLDLAIPADAARDRAAWNFKSFTPEGIVVSLGTNDFSLESTKPLDGTLWVTEYVMFLKRLRAEYPQANIFATEGAIVTDPLLRKYIQEAVNKVHDKKIVWAEARHYPGNGCDGHPSREQHVHMADDLEVEMRGPLGW